MSALKFVLYRYSHQGGGLPEEQVRDFDMALVGMLAFLAFLLQRTLSFDFRRELDGTSSAFALYQPAALDSPCGISRAGGLCLALQTIGVLVLIAFGVHWRFLFVLLAFPAIGARVERSLESPLFAGCDSSRRWQGGIGEPGDIVDGGGFVFFDFYPAGWLAIEAGRRVTSQQASIALGVGVWLVTQYAIDFLVVALIVRLFQRFEVATVA